MFFEWDEEKRQKVIADRQVDIVYAAQIFEGWTLTRLDDRRAYGEVREISLGMVDDECFVVVHTKRGQAIRIVTAWKGGRSDREHYQKSLARRHQTDEGAR